MKLLYPLIILLLSCSIEPEDCAGVAGGSAYLDECGVCDTDSTNDCNQSENLIRINGFYCGMDDANKTILLPITSLNPVDMVAVVEYPDTYFTELKINSISISNGELFDFGGFSVGDTFNVELGAWNGKSDYSLIFTTLSTAIFFTNESIVDEPKISSKLYINDLVSNSTYNMYAGIEIRGGTSQTYPKVSYDIELWEDNSGSDSRKESLLGLRNDDDWILDAMYIDLSLSRNLFGMKLWENIGNAIHLVDEPDAKISQSGDFIELFVNNEYLGIYSMNEQIDKKQLALKKNGGLLYKSEEWTDETKFSGINQAPDETQEWAGYELKYPDELDSINWLALTNLIDLIAYSDDEEFTLEISSHLDVDNAIDYYIFINLIQAEDNWGKNMYSFRYDEGYPISFAPWDLDLTLGNKNSEWTIDSPDDLILSNSLFNRLFQLNVDNYRNKLKYKWNEILGNINLNDLYQYLESSNRLDLINSNAIVRNNQKWDMNVNLEGELESLKTWLDSRIIFFDNYIEQNY